MKIKYTIIIFLTLIILVTIASKSIAESKKENTVDPLPKYYGQYNLVKGNIKNISQLSITGEIKEQKKQITIDKNNIELVDRSVNIAQDIFYLLKTDEIEIIYGGIHMFADYTDGHSDLDYQMCFKLIGNNLKQINCPEQVFDMPHYKTDNINLEYRKR